MVYSVPLWWFLISVVIAVFGIIFIINMFDPGHRGYVVVNEKVVKILAPILKKHSGLTELMTFTTSPVMQTVFALLNFVPSVVFTSPLDGFVIKNVEPAETLALIEGMLPEGQELTVQELVAQTGYLPNFCSILSKSPEVAVEETYKALKGGGFSAYILVGFMPEAGGQITLIASNAFVGWILVFRRHMLMMVLPGDPRLLTKVEGFLSIAKIMRADIRFRTWLKKLRGERKD